MARSITLAAAFLYLQTTIRHLYMEVQLLYVWFDPRACLCISYLLF